MAMSNLQAIEMAKHIFGRVAALSSENAALRKAVQSAESWIVDGGHLDASDPYKAESAAMVVAELRAALAWQTEGEG